MPLKLLRPRTERPGCLERSEVPADEETAPDLVEVRRWQRVNDTHPAAGQRWHCASDARRSHGRPARRPSGLPCRVPPL